MTPLEICEDALNDSHSVLSQLDKDPVEAKKILTSIFNESALEVYKIIVSDVNEDLFYDIWKTELVINPNGEFPLPKYQPATAETPQVFGMAKLKKVFVKLNKDFTDRIKANAKSVAELENDWDYYLNNQNENNPIFYLADNSVFIAPLPRAEALEIENDFLVMHGIRDFHRIANYETATEDEIFIPASYQPLIKEHMIPKIYRKRNKLNEETDALNKNSVKDKELVSQLSDREEGENCMPLPNDEHLQ